MDEFDRFLEETGATSEILRRTPNGVVLVDSDGIVRLANDPFRRMFGVAEGESIVGRQVREITRSDCFVLVFKHGGQVTIRGSVPELDVYYRAGLFAVSDDALYCGIFIDTTEEVRARHELKEMKAQTLARAKEVIQRQMHTAQEIAGLLGETTAETKVLLAKLADLFRQEETG